MKKKKNKLKGLYRVMNTARRLAKAELKKRGYSWPEQPSNFALVRLLENELGQISIARELSKPELARRVIELTCQLGKITENDLKLIDNIHEPVVRPQKQRSKGKSHDRASKFYQSLDWRRARYEALVKNDGRCELCGSSKADGVTLNVDHIKPLRFNWSLRIDPENLQVLCGPCNHGKGNKYEHDWRRSKPEPKKSPLDRFLDFPRTDANSSEQP